MSTDGRAVANFVLDFCESKNRCVTNLSLQKVVFFCHVWSLIRLNRPLVKHSFEAWEFGPVLPYLYRDFKDFERDPITCRARKIDPCTGLAGVVEYGFDDATNVLLQTVVDFYSRLSPSDLVRLSHTAGSPWDDIWNHKGKVLPGMKIENCAIIKYYSRLQAPFLVH
jgi:uncharacterized phage-associated protein